MLSLSNIISIGLTLFLVYALYVTLRILFYTRKAVLAGKQTRPASNVNPRASHRVLVIGDSTSYGTGAINMGDSLVGRLIRDYPDYEILNKSENGIGIKRVHEIISHIEETFDFVIIHIGGIDTLAFSRKKTIIEYMKKINEQAKRLHARTLILVSMNNAGSLPLMLFPLDIIFNLRSRLLSRLFAKICSENNIVHVPLFTNRKDEPLLQNGENHFSPDLIHPNDFGYGIWYEKVKRVFDTEISKMNS